MSNGIYLLTLHLWHNKPVKGNREQEQVSLDIVSQATMGKKTKACYLLVKLCYEFILQEKANKQTKSDPDEDYI